MTATNWSNITDLGQLPAAANTASDGSFWASMLYMIWIVLLIIMLAFGWEVALLVSAFLGFVVALMLAYAGLVAWGNVLFFLGLIIAMFLYIAWTNDKR